MKISNYSLNHPREFAEGRLDVFQFLALCRALGVEGASLHVRHLQSTDGEYLQRIRRAYLDQGLSVSMFTVSNDFGQPLDRHPRELEKVREAVRVAQILGAPLLRVFAGSPRNEADRPAAFDRAVAGLRKACQIGAEAGIPIGLQNHNHGALARTGEEVLRFLKAVDHPNLTFVLDTGQFAGCRGASGKASAELRDADYLASIRQTAPLARHVRAKFYHPRPDGSEPFVDYDQVLDILRAVHYPGFIDMVYEPLPRADEPRAALPRVVAFLRAKVRMAEGQSAPAQPAARYTGLDNDKFFAKPQVATETSVAFTEGPAVDRAGNVYFTNQPDRIYQWEPAARRLRVFREKSNEANGLMFDRQGRLVACEKGRVTRTDVQTGRVEVLVDHFNGKPLGSPNDLDRDGKDRIYFTSRLPNQDPKAGNVNSVYRIDLDGTVARVLALPDIHMPNGIAVSPDDKALYLIDADGGPNRARRIRAYDLQPDGTVKNERLLYDFSPGRSGDGMRIDAEGNLYVAAGLHRRRGSSETLDTRPGIHVLSPAGKLLAFVETPEDTLTNCAFGGPDLRTLYVTCGKLLLSLRTRIPGRPSYRPEK